MSPVEFFVPGPPVGKGRGRIVRRGPHLGIATPAKTVAYESLVAMTAAQAMYGAEPFKGYCSVFLSVSVSAPESWSHAKRLRALAGHIRPSKPDLDNIAKAILDGCNGVAYLDDVQVVVLTASKAYGTRPGVFVRIREMVPHED